MSQTLNMFGRRAVFLLLLATLILEGVSAKKKPKPSKKKKPCKYNGKKYKPGEVINALGDNCVVFRCASTGKKTELVAIDDCTCSKDDEPQPSASSIGFNDVQQRTISPSGYVSSSRSTSKIGICCARILHPST
ncbi:unnamed protein product, partial [Meganyctiphanes norvegica]